MARLRFLFLSSLVLALTSLHGTHAVTYTVTNTAGTTPGGTKFNDAYGVAYSRSILEAASAFIWQVFGQTNPSDRKNVESVSLFVDDMDGVAFATNNEIHLSARYVGGYSGDLRSEITGVLYHEMTHIWQWNGNRQAPGGLIEGIADFVRLKANYVPGHWVGPGGGDRWDQGYDITARFLEYCDGLKGGFVAELNGKMRTGYTDNFFVDILGKPVDQLWTEYKAKYGM